MIDSFGTIKLFINGGQNCFNGAKWNGLGQYYGLSKFDLQFIERISIQDFLVFKIVKKCFCRCNFTFYGLGLVFIMKFTDVILQYTGGNVGDVR